MHGRLLRSRTEEVYFDRRLQVAKGKGSDDEGVDPSGERLAAPAVVRREGDDRDVLQLGGCPQTRQDVQSVLAVEGEIEEHEAHVDAACQDGKSPVEVDRMHDFDTEWLQTQGDEPGDARLVVDQ